MKRLFVLVLFIMLTASCGSDYVAKINGTKIPAEELKMYMTRYRAEIYNEEDDENVFYDKLRRRAFDELCREKVIWQMAEEYDIVKSDEYINIIEEMEKENKKRAATKEKGEPVYGIIEFNEQLYFKERLSKIKIELRDTLLKEEEKVPEEELYELYLSTRERYKTQPECNLEVYKTDSLEAAKLFKERGFLANDNKIQCTKEEMNQGTAKYFYMMYPQLEEYLKNTDEGVISNIYSYGDGYILFKAVNLKKEGYKEFDDVKSVVRSLYFENKVEEMILQRIAEADVYIAENSFDKVRFGAQ